MHTRNRIRSVVAMAMALSMIFASSALADSLEGDSLESIGQTATALNLGTVCVGDSVEGTIHLAIRRQGGGAQVYANNAVVTVSPLSASAGLTAGPASGTITIPADWDGASNGTLSPRVTAKVTLDTSSVRTVDGSVTYRSSGSNSAGVTRTNDDPVPVQATVQDCTPPNTAPSVPGAPTATSPNNGEFTLTWSASEDAEDDDITYTLERKSAAGSTWSQVASGLTTNSRSFNKEDEGTWNYRVKASDGDLGSAFSAASAAIKVDRNAPAKPSASTTPASADYTDHDGRLWFKGNVTVNWTAGADPVLADGSTGTGSTAVPASQLFETDGRHTASSKSVDGVLNESGSESLLVGRDTAGPVISGSNVSSATWRNTPLSQGFTASDALSGLANSSDSPFTLEASAQSTKDSGGNVVPTTASKAVYDNVGNSTTRTLSALIDLTKPTSSVIGVQDGGVYLNSASPACQGQDALSGIASGKDGVLTGSGSGAGTYTVSCNGAEDQAGNVQSVASASVTYTVLALGQFNKNFDDLGVPTAKAGSAIPLRWAFSDGTSNVQHIDRIDVRHAAASACTAGAAEVAETADSGVASGNSGLQRLDDGSYQFNWKLTNKDTGCRRITIRMFSGDSTTPFATHSATVNFTK